MGSIIANVADKLGTDLEDTLWKSMSWMDTLNGRNEHTRF